MAACAFRRERPDESSALARPPDGASNGHQDYQDEKSKDWIASWAALLLRAAEDAV